MANKPSMKFISTTSNKLNNISVVAGQLIFCSDTRVIYLDTDKRNTYQAIISVIDEATRSAIVTPLEGYYYVKRENTLWSYLNSTWTQIVDSKQWVVFNDDELPQTGVEQTIYVNDTKMFRWDDDKNDYTLLGGSQWENL